MRALAGVLLLALPLAACTAGGSGGDAGASEAAMTTPDALSGTRWQLVAGLPAFDPAAVEITLGFEPGRIAGSGGCNRYSAELASDGDTVDVGPVVATKRGCLGPGGEAEGAYFAALEQVHTLRREGEVLLLQGEGVELRFRSSAEVR